MTDDIILEKAEIIENCLKRIHEEYAGKADNLYKNFTKQDSIFMNLERACQAAIDLAMHIVRIRKLGIPKESRDAFELLRNAALIPQELSLQMQKMVGFRNMAVHRYREIDLKIVEDALKNRLGDFTTFTQTILKQK